MLQLIIIPMTCVFFLFGNFSDFQKHQLLKWLTLKTVFGRNVDTDKSLNVFPKHIFLFPLKIIDNTCIIYSSFFQSFHSKKLLKVQNLFSVSIVFRFFVEIQCLSVRLMSLRILIMWDHFQTLANPVTHASSVWMVTSR